MIPMPMQGDPFAQDAGPPPELLQAMMGGAGAGGPMPPPQPPPEESPDISAIDHLRQAIEHSQAALTAEPDDADSQALAKVIQGLYAILAARQKEDQQMLGNPAMQRVLSRASG